MHHPYLGQETASPGQGEMMMSYLGGGSLVQGLERTGVRRHSAILDSVKEDLLCEEG